jgi:hypothetical protein
MLGLWLKIHELFYPSPLPLFHVHLLLSLIIFIPCVFLWFATVLVRSRFLSLLAQHLATRNAWLSDSLCSSTRAVKDLQQQVDRLKLDAECVDAIVANATARVATSHDTIHALQQALASQEATFKAQVSVLEQRLAAADVRAANAEGRISSFISSSAAQHTLLPPSQLIGTPSPPSSASASASHSPRSPRSTLLHPTLETCRRQLRSLVLSVTEQLTRLNVPPPAAFSDAESELSAILAASPPTVDFLRSTPRSARRDSRPRERDISVLTTALTAAVDNLTTALADAQQGAETALAFAHAALDTIETSVAEAEHGDVPSVVMQSAGLLSALQRIETTSPRRETQTFHTL